MPKEKATFSSCPWTFSALLCASTEGCLYQHLWLCFPEDPSCSPCLHSDGCEKPPARTPSLPLLGKDPGLTVKNKGHCPTEMGTQLVPARVPCPSPGAACGLASQAARPSWSPLLCSDVTFVVGREQQKVFAHRCVLACRCQAFRGMLGQGPSGSEDSLTSVPPQGPFILGNVQPEVFLAVIEFLYTNSVTLNSHIVSGDGAGGGRGHGRDNGGMQGWGGLCSSWGAEGGGDVLHDAFWLGNCNECVCVCGVSAAQLGIQSTLSHMCLLQPCDNWLCTPWMLGMGTPEQDIFICPHAAACTSPMPHLGAPTEAGGHTLLALGLPCPPLALHTQAHKVSLACRPWRC